MIGLIFGWYALFVLVGSLLLGKYVSSSSLNVTQCTRPSTLPGVTVVLSYFQIVQIGAKTMIILGIFVSAVCTILFG